MRLQQAEWPRIAQALGDQGWATTRPLLTANECADLIALYSEEHRFRSRIDMARFRFGEGEVGALFFDPARRYAECLAVPQPWSLDYEDYPFAQPR